MEKRDRIATEVRDLARKVGLAGYATDDSDQEQSEVLGSLRKMGLIADAEESAPAAAPAPTTIGAKAVRSNASRIEALLLTLQSSPRDRPVSEFVRQEAGQLLKLLRR